MKFSRLFKVVTSLATLLFFESGVAQTPEDTCTPTLVTYGAPYSIYCEEPLTTSTSCTRSAATLDEISDAAVPIVEQAVADRPSGCWYQPGSLEGDLEPQLYLNVPPEGSASVNCSEARPCVCCKTAMQCDTNKLFLASSGEPSTDACPRSLDTLEECSAAAGLLEEISSSLAPAVQQAAADRPDGCWFQRESDTLSSGLYFNSLPTAASAVSCSETRPCVCCAEVPITTTTTTPTACVAGYLDDGNPNASPCLRALIGVDECSSIGSQIATELASSASALTLTATQQSELDRPEGCWLQPGSATAGTYSMVFYNSPTSESTTTCSDSMLCLCCVPPTTTTTATKTTTSTQTTITSTSTVTVTSVTVTTTSTVTSTTITGTSTSTRTKTTTTATVTSTKTSTTRTWTTTTVTKTTITQTSTTATSTTTSTQTITSVTSTSSTSTTTTTVPLAFALTTSDVSDVVATAVVPACVLALLCLMVLAACLVHKVRKHARRETETLSNINSDPKSHSGTLSVKSGSEVRQLGLSRTGGSTSSSVVQPSPPWSLQSPPLSVTTQTQLPTTSAKMDTGSTYLPYPDSQRFWNSGGHKGGSSLGALSPVASSPIRDQVPPREEQELFGDACVDGLMLCGIDIEPNQRSIRGSPGTGSKSSSAASSQRGATNQPLDPLLDMRSPRSRRRASPKGLKTTEPVPRSVLMRGVFHILDSEGSGFLTCSDVLNWARFMGFEGKPEDWKVEYLRLCDYLGCDPLLGVDLAAFYSLLDDTSKDGCFCTNAELRAFLDDRSSSSGFWL